MHIVYVTQYYPPHAGGLEQVAIRQARAAHTAGHEVTVVTCAPDPSRVGVLDEGGVTVHRVSSVNTLDTRFGLPFSFVGISMLRTLVRAVRGADLVHLHDVFYMPSWFAYLVARYYHKDLVLTQHVALVAHPSRIVRAVQRVVYRTWGDAIFRYARTIVVYNKIVLDFLIGRGVPAHIVHEVRNGVSVRAFTPATEAERHEARRALGLPEDRVLVLFVGRMVPKKGYRELFEARDPAYDLVFVGPGSVPDSWRAEPNVHVLGEIPHEKLIPLYRAADVFCAPSKGELFTLVMQEACASGLPIVTTNELEYAGELDVSQVALVEQTSEAIKHALVRLSHDPDLRARMGAYARTLAEERFDWDKNARAVLDLYARLRTTRVQVTTSWDDGHVLDVRLSELLEKHAMTGTFYVSPDNVEFPPEERLSEDAIRHLAEKHEIGAHTLTHRHLTRLSDEEARTEIHESKRVLERTIGIPVVSFCYPAGRYAKRHATMVREAGYRFARTVKRFMFRAHDPFEAPTTIHTYDHWSDVWGVVKLSRGNPITFFSLYRRWDLQAMRLFDRALVRGGVFHLWGHSWELAENNGWERLESVLQYIHGRSGVAYLRNCDIV